MKMIAFYNNKGGVGKTSTAINIAYTLSHRKNRVLLIDFDGQCNSSRFFTELTNDESGCERAIKIENIKNNAIDSVKVAVENGELSISTANEIAKHNATKQQEIISSPIEKIKTADVRNINKDKSKAKMPKCDEPKIDSTSDEATEIYLTTDETMFMKKNLDILGFSYLLSVSSDSDKRIIENIISKIKGEKPNGKRC